MRPKHTILTLRWTWQQSPVPDTRQPGEIGSSPLSVRVSRDVCQSLAQVVGFRCTDRQRFMCCVPFKYLSAFLARVKSACAGNASSYDRHLVSNILYCLTPVMSRSFPTAALYSACWTCSRAVVSSYKFELFCYVNVVNRFLLQLNKAQAPAHFAVGLSQQILSAWILEYYSILIPSTPQVCED